MANEETGPKILAEAQLKNFIELYEQFAAQKAIVAAHEPPKTYFDERNKLEELGGELRSMMEELDLDEMFIMPDGKSIETELESVWDFWVPSSMRC